jgi:hypothetical protein
MPRCADTQICSDDEQELEVPLADLTEDDGMNDLSGY